jgi:precorrin-4 methylase
MYEYMIKTYNDVTDENLTTRINTHAKKGWRVVNVVQPDPSLYGAIIFFERPVHVREQRVSA